MAQLSGASQRTIKQVRAVGRKKPELIELIASGEKTLAEAERETGKRPPPEDAARTIKQIETSVEELAALLGDLAEETGKDLLTSAMIDVNGVMVAITTTRAGRDALIALEWPEVLDGE